MCQQQTSCCYKMMALICIFSARSNIIFEFLDDNGPDTFRENSYDILVRSYNIIISKRFKMKEKYKIIHMCYLQIDNRFQL